jgi:hypothetical protein
MRLSVKAAALVGAVLTGGTVFCLGILNLIFPTYADDFLRVMASIYPGFCDSGGFWNVIVGTLYGLLDGAIGGALIAWLYNQFLPRQSTGV